MAEFTPEPAWRVTIMEYERGWGSRVDEVKYFPSEKEAKQFTEKFNSQNTAATAPDWYMVAVYDGRGV